MTINKAARTALNKADESFVYIDQQLVEDNELIVDEDGVHNGNPVNVLKKPKGNTHYSVRPIELTKDGAEILEKMAEISEDSSQGQLVFTFQGRPLTTDTFNRRLKKYCSEAGIEYRSSHKIRFCDASMLYQIGGMPLDQLRRIMGHSNPRMTEHYAQQNVQEPVNTGIMQSVSG